MAADPEPQTAHGGPGDVEAALLTRKLLELWRSLEPYVSAVGHEPLPLLSPDERLVVREWRSRFDHEIFLVQAARNVLVDTPEALTTSDLRGAVEMGQKLWELLVAGLRSPQAVLGSRNG